ncbi:complex I NDUFA9 subunit family protein [Xanthobacter sp. TB0136]|uniref:complex I NDUFA9 subunit family protein n=1 Tax=Xanthobacter sp. TB0136 TaxID=3459177 RepID=UPI00403A476A
MSDVAVSDRPVSGSLVTVFGGSGFLGRHVVRALAQRGYRIRVAVRRPQLAGFLRTMGAVGQIEPIQANLRFPDSITRAVAGADVVVNLVGILAQGGRQQFDSVHVEGARAVAKAAAAAGVRMVHVSAIGADSSSPSGYGRSKGEGEAAVRAAMPDAVILRPSLMYGPDDRFFNRFASMARMSPLLPLVGGGVTKFQPVFVGDVASVVQRVVDGDARPGTIYELGGPEVRSFRELMDLLQREIGTDRGYLNLPFGLASFVAGLTQWIPGAPLTTDQVAMLRKDNVVSEAARAEGRDLSAFGITPAAVSIVLPTYIWRFRKAGQFTQLEA